MFLTNFVTACTVCDPTTTGNADSGYEATACTATANTVCTGKY